MMLWMSVHPTGCFAQTHRLVERCQMWTLRLFETIDNQFIPLQSSSRFITTTITSNPPSPSISSIFWKWSTHSCRLGWTESSPALDHDKSNAWSRRALKHQFHRPQTASELRIYSNIRYADQLSYPHLPWFVWTVRSKSYALDTTALDEHSNDAKLSIFIMLWEGKLKIIMQQSHGVLVSQLWIG